MKKIFSLICAIVLSFGLCAFVACGGSTSSSTTGNSSPSENSSSEAAATAYTIVVKYEDGTPVEGSEVILCVVDENGVQGACFELTATDANGKTSTESRDDIEEVVYHIGLKKTPTGYTYDQELHTTVDGTWQSEAKYGTYEVVLTQN